MGERQLLEETTQRDPISPIVRLLAGERQQAIAQFYAKFPPSGCVRLSTFPACQFSLSFCLGQSQNGRIGKAQPPNCHQL